MYFITIKRMLEVCFSAHPNIQYRAVNSFLTQHVHNLNRCAVVPWGSLDAGPFS